MPQFEESVHRLGALRGRVPEMLFLSVIGAAFMLDEAETALEPPGTIPGPNSKATDRYHQGIGKIAAGYERLLSSLAEVIDPTLASTWQTGGTALRMKFNLDEAAFYLSIVAGALDGVTPAEERSNLERIYKFVNEKKHSLFLQPSSEFGDLAAAGAALQELLRILERPEILSILERAKY